MVAIGNLRIRPFIQKKSLWAFLPTCRPCSKILCRDVCFRSHTIHYDFSIFGASAVWVIVSTGSYALRPYNFSRLYGIELIGHTQRSSECYGFRCFSRFLDSRPIKCDSPYWIIVISGRTHRVLISFNLARALGCDKLFISFNRTRASKDLAWMGTFSRGGEVIDFGLWFSTSFAPPSWLPTT